MARISNKDLDKSALVEKYNKKLIKFANRDKIPIEHLPKPISSNEALYLTQEEVYQMYKATTLGTLKNTKTSVSKQDGQTYTYSKAMLDVTNIRIQAENRKRQRRREQIAEYDVYRTAQVKKKGITGEKNKFRTVYAGKSGQMEDLSKAGLKDLAQISGKRGTIDTATAILSHQKAIDRDEAQLYAENLKLSLLASYPNKDIVPLVNILDQVDDEVLLEMYYSDTDISIPDWYIQVGRDEEALKAVLEQTVYSLEKWAARLKKRKTFSEDKYKPLLNLRKTLNKAPALSEINERNKARLERVSKGDAK